MWIQKEITLEPRSQGIYLIDQEVLSKVPDIRLIKAGIMTVFCKHTSCGITLNESWDPSVRTDFQNALNKLAPESGEYLHDDEGSDDMPSHIKCSLVGCTVMVPITNGKPNLGTWQGLYFCEFRRYMHQRTLVITIHGEK
ncbi:hypothetical protein DASB73_014670 [Starmerella bacillaris]|uniref:Secondary thiamine-phosphate synthase enzyme n=1 Tax=Starmerella bacillaris TaxID=1247836 RepID=A0AAV5RJ03_STABA|nr:hypothetical protein DASB73_014670 [Starmerella bacillaris]